MKKTEPKLLIVSQALAPSVGGSQILINNLFSKYKGPVSAISGHPGQRVDPNFITPFPTTYFSPPTIPFISSWIDRYHDYILKYLHPLLIRLICREIDLQKPDAIFSHCPNIDYFICAYRAAKKKGIRFYTHMHDLWQENYPPDSYRGRMASRWEQEILTNSKRVYCMTDMQKVHYDTKYGIQTSLLPHTVTDEVLDGSVFEFNEDPDDYILFTGAISPEMNIDALRIFSESFKHLDGRLDFRFCSSATAENMQYYGIDTTDWKFDWLTREAVQSVQRKAAILFAPLSHKNAAMDEVKTVFSTKLLEYLVSGRPILIFAPSHSFHALSARVHGWGYVVDNDDPHILAQAVLTLMRDIPLQKRLVINAFEEARRRRSSIYSKKLYQDLLFDANV